MANRHLLSTISIVFTVVAIFLSSIYIFEPIIFFGMGLYAYGSSFMIMGVFKKYRPEMDEDHLVMAPLPELNFEEVFEDEKDDDEENGKENDEEGSQL